jgi:hypothetical protein
MLRVVKTFSLISGLFLLSAASIRAGIQLPAATPGTTQETQQERMERYNRALGVECTHCHLAEKWPDESKPQFAIARNMASMVDAINEHLSAIGKIGCWTCHRGEIKPSRLPRAALDAELARWPKELEEAPESQKLTMAVYNVTLGVGCNHCHTADWKEASKPQMQTVETMNRLFEIFPKFMPASARTQCFMCHKGATKPPKTP